jgi:hypothetical protein
LCFEKINKTRIVTSRAFQKMQLKCFFGQPSGRVPNEFSLKISGKSESKRKLRDKRKRRTVLLSKKCRGGITILSFRSPSEIIKVETQEGHTLNK